MNTKVRIDIDGPVQHTDLDLLLAKLDGMRGFDFEIHIQKIRIVNPDYYPTEKGEFDDNNYFFTERSKHVVTDDPLFSKKKVI